MNVGHSDIMLYSRFTESLVTMIRSPASFMFSPSILRGLVVSKYCLLMVVYVPEEGLENQSCVHIRARILLSNSLQTRRHSRDSEDPSLMVAKSFIPDS